MRNTLFAWMLVVLIGVAAVPADAAPFSSVYVFGDGFVDSGNAPADAAQGYVGGRYSNGLNFADHLALKLAGTALQPSSAGGTNYAYGGGRIRDNGDGTPDLMAQVAAFRADHASPDPDALYIVNVSAGDLVDLLGRLPISVSEYEDIIQAVTNSLALLMESGARHIVFTGIADVARAPLFAGSPDRATAEMLANTFAGDLDQRIDELLGMLIVDVDFWRFSYADFNAAVLADPEAFGLSDITDFTNACVAVAGPGADCSGYAYFDQLHPTAQVHEAIASEIAAQVTVPEPAALGLLGLGIIAVVSRRRRYMAPRRRA